MFKVDKVPQQTNSYGRKKNDPDVYEADYKYYLSYDTNNDYSCEESGCNSEGICRCGRIREVKVDSSLEGANYFFSQAYEDTASGIDRALDHWFTRKHFPNIVWTFESSGGYYGEELHRIYPESDHDFFNKAATFKDFSVKEKVEYMLIKEYGCVLPEVQKVKDWELKAILTSDIIQSANTHLNGSMLKSYKDYCERIIRLNHKTFQDDTRILAPLTLRSGKGYQVIDGHHRTEALTSEYDYDVRTNLVRQVNKKQKNGIIKVVNKQETKKSFVSMYMWIICPKET